jgi:hypothetical protein
VRTELGRQQYPLEKQIRDLKDEHESLSGREGLVPPPLHRARVTIAEQMDCLPEDLPFVAELIDIAAGDERWRKAAEVTLSATARIMLIDEDLLDHLSRTIDSVRIPVRINFEGVPLHDYEEFRGDPRRISGKLVFKDSLFSWWVQNRVQVRGTDALCVHGPEELGGDDLRVTPTVRPAMENAVRTANCVITTSSASPTRPVWQRSPRRSPTWRPALACCPDRPGLLEPIWRSSVAVETHMSSYLTSCGPPSTWMAWTPRSRPRKPSSSASSPAATSCGT